MTELVQTFPARWGDQIALLSDENLERLRREDAFGSTGNFGPAVESLRVIRNFVAALSAQDPKYEPTTLSGEVTAHLEAAKNEIGQIEAYDGTGDAATTRQNIFTRLDNERGWFAEKVGPVLGRSDTLNVAEALAELRATRDEVRALREQTASAATATKALAGGEGASVLANYFDAQAASHRSSAWNYIRLAGGLIATLSIVALVLFLALPITLPLTTQDSWIQFARDLLPRLFVLGVLAYGVRFAVRNYAINKHLQVSNEQRANILKTFDALVSSVDGEDKGRMSVLLATAAVAGIDSGYLTQAEDKGLDSTALMAAELVKR
jgi:hypothetical protein